MKVVFGILNHNHATQWAAALECLAIDYPGLQFSKAIAIGTPARKEEFDELSEILKEKFYPKCQFDGHFPTTWANGEDESRKLNLAFIQNVLSEEIRNGNDLYLINSCGNKGQREPILLISRIFCVDVFDRFQRNSEQYIPKDLFKIPLSQIDKMVKDLPDGVDTEDFKKKYYEAVATRAADTNFVDSLSNLNLTGDFINYEKRWRDLGIAYDNRKSLYLGLESKVEQILETICKRGEFIIKPKVVSRIKEKTSIWNKLLVKESGEGYIKDPFDRFTDVIGFRVEFSNQRDMDRGIQLIIEEGKNFVNHDGEVKIEIDRRTRTFGYRAEHVDIKLHPTNHLHPDPNLIGIVFEIQFKTALASTWSELHHSMIYKAKRDTSLNDDELNQMNISFVEAAKLLEKADQKLNEICEVFNT